MPSININSIPAGTVVSVTGLVDFSRIRTQIAGEELAADNAKRTARGLIPNDKPHTRLTIRNCQVDYADPNAPTDAEKFVAEKLYTTKNPEKGYCFTPVNKSTILPNTYVRDNAQSKQLERLVLENELDAGVPVTVNVRFFKTNLNSGLSLDSVIVNEKPVRYYSPNGESALTSRGFTIVDSPETDAQAIAAHIDAQPVPEAPVAQAAPAPAPSAAPYMQQPVNTVPAASAAPAPVAQATPAPASSLPTPPAGYTYDADGRIVPISTVGNTQPTGGISL